MFADSLSLMNLNASDLVSRLDLCIVCQYAAAQTLMCNGSVVVTAYDFESGRPGSNPEWGLIYYEASITAQAYPNLHPSRVVHWVPEQLNMKAVTWACKLIDGCSLAPS